MAGFKEQALKLLEGSTPHGPAATSWLGKPVIQKSHFVGGRSPLGEKPEHSCLGEQAEQAAAAVEDAKKLSSLHPQDSSLLSPLTVLETTYQFLKDEMSEGRKPLCLTNS